MIKKTIVKEAPTVLDKTLEQVRFESVMRNAKRISLLVRDLEVTALDVASYAKPLAKGNFPRSYINEISAQLEHGITELNRVLKSWQESFVDVSNE